MTKTIMNLLFFSRALLLLAAALTTVATPSSSYAQFGAPTTTTIFQNITEGFRVQLPNGWVVEESAFDDETERQAFIAQYGGWDLLAIICPQNQALPEIGGVYDCIRAPGTDDVGVSFFKSVNLHTRPEFAPLASQNQSITINDIVALDIEFQRERFGPEVATRLQIENQVDRTVNVLDAATNQTVQTVPAKEVKYRITAPEGTIFALYSLVVLTDNGNTAYAVHPETPPIQSDEETPSFVRKAFDSFELIE